MIKNCNGLRRSVLFASAMAFVMAAGSASAATRNMVGSWGVQNPSVGAPFLFEGGPKMMGRGRGAYPPNAGFQQVQVTGAPGATAVGRQITIPANLINFSKMGFRDFTAFPSVAQTTKSAMTVQQQATFMNGGGALAACPGPGCTGVNGSGTAISWCPPQGNAVPAPGTAMAPVGNWNCANWGAPGAGNRGKRIAINNSPTAPHYGGTYRALRNMKQNVWRVLVQPPPEGGEAVVSRSWMSIMNWTWTAGLPNFEFKSNPGNVGPHLKGILNARGAVIATNGCDNGVGTVGAPFLNNGIPILGPGNNCGTNAVNRPAGQGWGFKMTTGTVSGSDVYPFFRSTTMTNVANPGTPFKPKVVLNPQGVLGFFFTRMGSDSVVGTQRNIVLIGGAATYDPGSNNAFDRTTDLRMTLSVPEPAAAAGLLIGAGALLAVARRRR